MRPKIITLVGSTRFKETYEREMARLTLEGYIVISVGLYGHADGLDLTPTTKRKLDALHLCKIDLADIVHVINDEGYIGESTNREIAYAEAKGLPVTYYWLGGRPVYARSSA
jgi:hypothetical protein